MDILLSVLPIFFIFLIFYFLVIRPQSRLESKRREFIKNLKKGDIVYTSGGIIGKVYDISDKTLTLEISKDVRLKILRDTVQGPFIEKTEDQDKKQQQKQQKEEKNSDK
ncbi:MAG: preprotein translocase subunit YajC [Candidatus Calescibacterium sp.]|nr:preprotein translocase subunit YajC [Candidatus Calescibacterium sp.]MCX7734480.1 preprotein translocase subunit YajC [bacterium]MDW8087326.1 preprotein translocase subunit YajC [Candidatus Calescibacterium sp.]